MNKLLKDYSKKTVIPTGKINGAISKYSENIQSIYSDSESEDEGRQQLYEQDFVKDELKKYAAVQQLEEKPLDDLHNVETGGHFSGNGWDVYDHHNFSVKLRLTHTLPIEQYKTKILGLLNVNNVLIIQGPTGCGKTTQVPQFILDDCRHKAEMCNIIVTQPRRIAAINIARRVCAERSWNIGEICGYQVGLEREIKQDVLLTFVTTGVLLQRLIRTKTLTHFSHIIIDEVHERNQELDFLLLLVRRFLYTNSPNTKVILMSATIDTKEFAHYFRTQNAGVDFLAPVVEIQKSCEFKKQIFYLDQLPLWIGEQCTITMDKPGIDVSIYKLFVFLVNIFDRLDIVDPTTNERKVGSVLVFLPGLMEIEEAHKRLMSADRAETGTKWEVIPLHSSLPSDEQAKVFKIAEPGHRKVILSTNIAESSITVSDITYVIDFCLTKVMTVDPISNYSSLKLEWASHVNCEQRAGRVGRVGDGRVYRLIPQSFFENEMVKRGAPEILRAPLENVVLQAKMLNLNETPKQVLALALDPPNLKSIELTIWRLKEAGGLLMTCRGVKSSSDGDLTFLGTVMANLPVDIRLSKLIVLGHMFSCLEHTIIMAAGCSIQNIFAIPFQERFNAYQKLLLWSDNSGSDLIALYNLYSVWQNYKRENNFDAATSEANWCKLNYVSLKGLREWHVLVTEIKNRLANLKITNTTGSCRTHYTDKEKPIILKVIICGAFYPNYFIRSDAGGQVDEREAVRSVGGRDPFKTVYFTGMQTTQPKELYVRAIKKLMHGHSAINEHVFIGFDGSNKIYVEYRKFNQPILINADGQQQIATIPNKIPVEVYEAVRKRQLRYNFELNLLPDKDAWKFSEKIKNEPTDEFFLSKFSGDYNPIPDLDTEVIKVIVTAVINAGNFWVQVQTNETNELLAKIFEALNKEYLHPVEKYPLRGMLSIGSIYAARFEEDKKFYRCILHALSADTAQVLFIDYGNTQTVKIHELYHLPKISECNVAPIAVLCKLKGVKPSLLHSPIEEWEAEASQQFEKHTQNIILIAKVYSVVNDIMHLELYRRQTDLDKYAESLNAWMISSGFAQEAEESYHSKEDHDKRMQVIGAADPNDEATRWREDRIVNYSDYQAPTYGQNFTTVQLRGPFSPVEMKVFGCTRNAGSKTVDIAGNSVNTVLLDSDPQDPHTRLLVAAYVAQSENASRLLLRHTTLMPNIPGFPILMALIFCPTMEPKVCNNGMQAASILCGLGCNEITERPCYPANDMVMSLDTELTVEDVEMVNKLRYLMNNFVRCMDEIYNGIGTVNDLMAKQRTFKQTLMSLLCHPKKSIKRKFTAVDSVWGNTNSSGITLRSSVENDPSDIWPLLWFVQLTNDNEEMEILENLEELKQIARREIPARIIQCILCKEEICTLYETIHHLLSPDHTMKENIFSVHIEK